jgi:hypothetical protein
MSEYRAPDSIVISQWATQFRYGLILLAGIGFGGTWAKTLLGLSDEQLTGYVAGAVTAASFLAWVIPASYGALRNYLLRREIKDVVVATAVTSAETGVPTLVDIVKTPIGVNNIAVPSVISPTDIQEAAIVPARLAGGERAVTAMLNRTQGS